MTTPAVSVAVEGESDRGMAEALLAHVGLGLERVLVKRGVANLDKLIPRLARPNTHQHWVVFRDADTRCPVDLRQRLIGTRPHDASFELRLPCSMTEAWLLADTAAFAAYFMVKKSEISLRPDDLRHAKHELLRLCRTSRSRDVRAEVFRPDDDRPGPLYTDWLNKYARDHWSAERASELSPSRPRCA